MTPLPTTTVSGYLGSGKTTLINGWLSLPHGQAITVLVNDFGAVALDEALIEARDGDVIALANGCMCCQIGGALYDTIDDVLRLRAGGRRIDHLVIETSGVADPARIAAIAEAEPDLEARHTLVLVDAAEWPARMADPLLADTLARQIDGASLVLITKTDLAPAEPVRAALTERWPETPALEATPAEALALLDETPPVRPGKIGRLRPHDAARFTSWAWQGDATVPREALEAFARADLGFDRLKGIVATPDGPVEVQRAGQQTTLRPGERRPVGLVAIGPAGRMNEAAIARAWAAILRESAARASR